MTGYLRILIPEIRQAQAIIPTMRARNKEINEIRKVYLRPDKNSGIYSRITLKLKFSSMGSSVFYPVSTVTVPTG
jgi:hypothetical protein